VQFAFPGHSSEEKTMTHRIPFFICLITVLLCGIPSLQAETLEELYQAAIMAEKGQGDLEKAIRLYEKVIKKHEEEGIEKHLAARAQLRIGVCQEKLGLKKARAAYQQVPEKFPDQPQAVVAAARRIQSTHQREVQLETQAKETEFLGIRLEGFEQEVQRWAREAQDFFRGPVSFRKPFASYAFTQPRIPYPRQSAAQVPMKWKFMLDSGPLDPQKGGKYSRKDFDDGHWPEIAIGQAWEDQGYESYDGGAWYRAEIQIDAKDDEKPILMAFGGVAARDIFVYVNGKLAGQRFGGWRDPFIFDIGAQAEYHGKNDVAIFVYDDAGMGGLYGLVNIHQPAVDGDVSHFVANRGGSLAGYRGRSTSISWSSRSRKPYASYAFKQPIVPYPHRSVADVPLEWKFILDYQRGSRGQGAQYSRRDFDASGWSQISVGQAWEDQGYQNYNGGAWYRAEIDVDAKDDEKPILMAFGGVDEDGYVYINGKYAGEHHVWDRPFILDVTGAVDRKGKNAVAIYVHDRAGMGGFYGMIDLHQPSADEKVDSFIANKGGSLGDYGRSRNNRFSLFERLGKRYESYAFRQPQINYPYRSVAQVPMKWKFTLDHGKPTSEHYEKYPGIDFDDSDWSEISIGQAWEDQGHRNYDEGAWYRAEIEIDARDDGKPILMAFGGVDKDAWIYVNGKLVGEHHAWDRPFILDISEAAAYHGKNVIAIRVYDGEGMGGIYGTIDIHQPITDVNLGSYSY